MQDFMIVKKLFDFFFNDAIFPNFFVEKYICNFLKNYGKVLINIV